MDTCPSCGTELPIIGGGAFCTSCGALARTESSDRSHDDTVTLPALPASATGVADMPVTDPVWTAPSAPSAAPGAGSGDPFAGFFHPAPGDPNPQAMTQIMPAVAPATHVPGRANRSVMVAVGVAVVAVVVVAVSLITLGGGSESPAAQVPPGHTEVVRPTSADTSATPRKDGPAASASTSATPKPSATSAGPRPSRVTGVGSGRCVGIPGAKPVDGTQLELFSCDNPAAQSWTYTHGTVQAIGKCVDVRGADSRDRTPVQIFACNGNPGQQWKYDPQTGELQTLGKCLDASGAGTGEHTPLILYTCHHADNQKWRMAS
jgi:hypothetical protein